MATIYRHLATRVVRRRYRRLLRAAISYERDGLDLVARDIHKDAEVYARELDARQKAQP